MSDFDAFAADLFEQAKRFREKAAEADSAEGKQAYLTAALLHGVASLEAQMNTVAEDLLLRDELSVLDDSILSEKDFTLKNGEFELTNRLKMYRVEDRLQYMFANHTKDGDPKTKSWWPGVAAALDLRNKIVHAKAPQTLSEAVIERALKSILECLNALYKGVFKKGYPEYKRGLDSSMTF